MDDIGRAIKIIKVNISRTGFMSLVLETMFNIDEMHEDQED